MSNYMMAPKRRRGGTLVITMLLLVIALIGFSVFLNHIVYADDPLTTTITIDKYWLDDIPADRPDNVVVNVKRDSSTLISGSEMNARMKRLSHDGNSETSFNYAIYAIKQASEEEYSAVEPSLTPFNEIQASGEKSYMWFDDANHTIYLYSKAGRIYAPSDFGDFARKMVNLVDISGLAIFDTTYVTTIDRMFQDSSSLSDLSPLAGWNTTNITDMTFTFGGNTTSLPGGGVVCEYSGHNTEMNITDLSPLASWDVRNVIEMYQTFKCNTKLTSLAPISDWDVKNVKNMSQLFINTSVSSISSIEEWDVSRVTDFTSMLRGAPLSPLEQSFSVRSPGAFDPTGSYITSVPANPNPDPVEGKTDTGDLLTCADWIKDDENNKWTCVATVSNDGADYVVWEGNVPGYIGSTSVTNPVAVVDGQAVISNTLDSSSGYFITLANMVSGSASDPTKTFTFNVVAYDEDGNEISSHHETVTLKNGESRVLFALPHGYSYSIEEAPTDYSTSYVITNSDDGTQISAAANAITGRVMPNENQTVTFQNTKTNDPTKVITITKEWVDDAPLIRPQPNDVTVKVKKTVSYLPAGQSLKSTMVGLAGGISNIKAIKKVDVADCVDVKPSEATKISTSGDDTFMWWESSSSAIYMCSVADNVFANTDMLRAFSGMINLEDISGLALLNTSYVDNMGLMFQDDVMITDLSPLTNWDTTNVTSMRFMFGSNSTSTLMNYNDLSPLAGWNTGNVIDMNQMFKGCSEVDSVEALKHWDVRNVADMHQMFNRIGIGTSSIPDVSVLAGWNPSRVGSTYISVADGSTRTGNFNMMFANAGLPNSSLPIFSERPGIWSGNANYTANSGPATSPVDVPKKIDNTPTMLTCKDGGNVDGTWDTALDDEGKWTCSLTVSNDGVKYTVWEEPISLYDSSATQSDPATLGSDTATITNKRRTYVVTVKKFIKGNLADINKTFDFSVDIYNGDSVIDDLARSFTLGEADNTDFKIPTGFAYQITENNEDYNTSYKRESSTDGSVLQTQTVGATTGKIVPTSDESIIFTNDKEKSPSTGIMDNSKAYILMISIVFGGIIILVIVHSVSKSNSRIRDG